MWCLSSQDAERNSPLLFFSLRIWAGLRVFIGGARAGECACDERDRAESANPDDNVRNTLFAARKVAEKSRCSGVKEY